MELQFQPLSTWPLHLGGGSGTAGHSFFEAASLRFLYLKSRTLSFPSISWDSPRSQSLIVGEPQVLQVRRQNIQQLMTGTHLRNSNLFQWRVYLKGESTQAGLPFPMSTFFVLWQWQKSALKRPHSLLLVSSCQFLFTWRHPIGECCGFNALLSRCGCTSKCPEFSLSFSPCALASLAAPRWGSSQVGTS